LESNSKTKDIVLSQFFHLIQQKIDLNESIKLRKRNPNIFEKFLPENFEKVMESEDSKSILASTSNSCFVIMPYDLNHQTVYNDLILPVTKKFRLTAIRADEFQSSANVMEQIRIFIRQAKICIVVISPKNHNIYFEARIGQKFGKLMVLLSTSHDIVPVDLQSHRIVIYDPNNPENSLESLEKEIDSVLKEDIIFEINGLVERNLYNGAAVLLGMLIEQKLMEIIDANMNQIKENVNFKQITIGSSSIILEKYGIITRKEFLSLRKCTDIRNIAAHHGTRKLSNSDIIEMKTCLENLQMRFP
jgi:hypothetical protein